MPFGRSRLRSEGRIKMKISVIRNLMPYGLVCSCWGSRDILLASSKYKITLQGVTSQKTIISIVTALRTTNQY
jgi:hypothetical protein